MAMTSKARLIAPNDQFCTSGTHSGVWKRKTVTSCWNGRLVLLATDTEAAGTCCCDIIRLGDDFAIARTFGDPKNLLREYGKVSGMSRP